MLETTSRTYALSDYPNPKEHETTSEVNANSDLFINGCLAKRDLSPPRRRSTNVADGQIGGESDDGDRSPPRRARQSVEDEDLSPPRRRQRADSGDLSPPRRPAGKLKDEDLSPPRKQPPNQQPSASGGWSTLHVF